MSEVQGCFRVGNYIITDLDLVTTYHVTRPDGTAHVVIRAKDGYQVVTDKIEEFDAWVKTMNAKPKSEGTLST